MYPKYRPGQRIRITGPERLCIPECEGNIFIIERIEPELVIIKKTKCSGTWTYPRYLILPAFDYKEEISFILNEGEE